MSIKYDVSVIITAHDEGVIAGPSIKSAEIAIEWAEAAGFSVERLVAYDRPTADCRSYFEQTKLKHWRKCEFDFGDPFMTRNAAVDVASGKWISFLDADDLFSANWLSEGCRVLADAEVNAEKVIVHPELNCIFEKESAFYAPTPQDDEFFLPHYFYFMNYYDMMCLSPREACQNVRYDHRDLKKGFGYQDWQWNLETIDAGWRHAKASDTIIFKRRRENSVSAVNKRRGAVVRHTSAMDIDRVRSMPKV